MSFYDKRLFQPEQFSTLDIHFERHHLQRVSQNSLRKCSRKCNLPVAQLVERETVRVALYLEVACSTQALEIPFTRYSISLLVLFPQLRDVLP